MTGTATALSLGNMGDAAKSAVADLAGALKDASEDVRDSALQALGNLGPLAKEAVPAILAYLESVTDDAIRDAATEALKKIQTKK